MGNNPMSLNWGMDKQNVVCPYVGILQPSQKKEQISNTCNNMAKS